MGLIDVRWAINEVPVKLEVAYRVLQTRNLDGLCMSYKTAYTHPTQRQKN